MVLLSTLLAKFQYLCRFLHLHPTPAPILHITYIILLAWHLTPSSQTVDPIILKGNFRMPIIPTPSRVMGMRMPRKTLVIQISSMVSVIIAVDPCDVPHLGHENHLAFSSHQEDAKMG